MANVEIIQCRETENLMKDTNAFITLVKIGYLTELENIFDVPTVRVGWGHITAEKVGLSQQSYRTAKKKLKEWGLCEFEETTKGTYARLKTNKFVILKG